MSHRVSLNWIGGRHAFAMPIGGLRAVQDLLGEGPMVTLAALQGMYAKVDAPLIVLKVGLTWGGMPEPEARALIDRLAELHPWAVFAGPAAQVMRAGVTGVADDDPAGDQPEGEPGGAPQKTPAGETPES